MEKFYVGLVDIHSRNYIFRGITQCEGRATGVTGDWLIIRFNFAKSYKISKRGGFVYNAGESTFFYKNLELKIMTDINVDKFYCVTQATYKTAQNEFVERYRVNYPSTLKYLRNT